MADRQYSITVRDLTKNFGKFRAVDRVTFDVKRGEIFGFLGANGAGKSTTIRMLCGLLKPSSGAAAVAGHDVLTSPEKVKRSIGYMSQKFSLYGDLTVNENIRFYGGVYGLSRKKIEQRRGEILELLDLGDRRKSLAGELPHGFQQRLAFACAILHEPDIIFLDEPTGGVDPLQRRNFWDMIYDFSEKGVTIFVTTHFLDEAEFCHRICLIAAGEIIADDTPSGLKKTLSDFEIYEIECDRPVEALDLMQKADWIVQASIFGSAIHATAAKEDGLESRLKSSLEDTGMRVSRIEPIEPSLEDVFLYLVEDRN